ncbi:MULTISPECIES: PqiC family protein [Methylotenera]|uniref:PqiC family protein n=1 Tax=Methylotenera TaxID=359407 RepID=UPI0003754B33|nr:MULTISPECIES: PqiC family protein [Methylotenera]
MNLTKYTALIFALAAMLTACVTPINATRFYTLANTNAAKNQAENVTAVTPIAIEVLPINVPERLKRPQLVITTNNASQLKILEQERWSSSFNDELQDAFVSGISSQLSAIDISRGGRTANQPTYRIAIVLQQFNATPGEQVQANFGWTITRLDAGARSAERRALSCQTTISKMVSNDMDAVVKGVQEAVADVIQAISANVTSLNSGEEAKCNS